MTLDKTTAIRMYSAGAALVLGMTAVLADHNGPQYIRKGLDVLLQENIPSIQAIDMDATDTDLTDSDDPTSSLFHQAACQLEIGGLTLQYALTPGFAEMRPHNSLYGLLSPSCRVYLPEE